MKSSLIFLGIFLFFSFWLSGCGKMGEDGLGRNELVRINDVSISLEEFREISEKQSLEGKMRLISEKGSRDFLDNYVITREVLYQEAKRKGFDHHKEIKAKVEDFRRAMVIDALIEEVLKDKSDVSENEVRQYYKENEDQFTEPKEVKICHIVVNSEPTLKDVLTKLSKGGSFKKLASQYNIDRSKEDGGNLGYLRRGQLSPLFAQFEETAFSLREKGDRSGVVKTPFGYHIIQLEDKRGTVLRPFDQVKEKILFFIQTKKRQDAYLAYVKEVKSKVKIAINEKLWVEEEKKEPMSTEGKK